MTDQHPLTDDIIRYDKKLGCHDLGAWVYTENDLRAAADWQLEQVVQWIEDNLLNPRENRRQLYVYDNDRKTYMEFDYELIDRLTQAMRHTQEDNQ